MIAPRPSPFTRRPRRRWSGAALALVALAGSARADVHVACPGLAADEVRRLLALERTRPRDASVRCDGSRARLRMGPPERRRERLLDLAATPPTLRPRLVALALVELASTPPPPRRRRPAPKPEEPEMNMFKNVIASGLALSLAAAAFAAPGGRGVPTGVGAAAPAPPTPRSPRAPTVPPPPPARAAVPSSAPSPARPSAPALTERDLREVKLQEVTVAQLHLLERLLAHTRPGEPERADVLFRIAELHRDRERAFEFQARALDEPLHQARTRDDADAAGRLSDRQADLQLRAEKARLEAARAYLQVAEPADAYPGYARMDEVLFALAHLLREAGKRDPALGYLKRLIKDHPASRLAPDAWLFFGEHAFEEGEVATALRFYRKVLAFPDSPAFAYARYKEGWCHLNLGDPRQALAAFVDVIGLAGRGEGARTRAARFALEREARKDAVRAYALVGEPDAALPFFRRIGGDHAPAMMEQLAETWNASGRFADAIRVYHRLMAAEPASPRLCAWQAEVVRNHLSATGSRAEASTVRELLRLAEVYEKVRTGGLAGEPLAECRERAAGSLHELATTWHREAGKTGDPATFGHAERLYREHLARFGDAPAAYDVGFYLGELLAQLAALPGQTRRHCDAAAAYSDVVERDASRKGRHLREAAWAAVLSWRSCLGVDDAARPAAPASPPTATRPAPDGPSPTPRPIPAPWRRMLDAFEAYTRHVADEAERIRVRYRAALVYYEYDHLAAAVPLFEEVARSRDPELSGFAVNLLLDCLALLRRGPAVRAAVAEYCDRPDLAARADLRPRCREIRAALLRQDAEEHERARRFREAGETYLRVAADFPDYPRLDEVYFDAAVDFERAGLVGRAIQSLQQLLEDRPDAPLARRAQLLLGRSFQRIAAYDASADAYEAFAARWPDDDEAPAALLTAAFFRRGLGQDRQAIDDADRFVRAYAARDALRERAAGTAFAKGRIFEERRDGERLRRHLAGYLRDFGDRGGVDRRIVAHVRLAALAWRAACPVPGANGDQGAAKPPPLWGPAGGGACVEVQRPAGGRAAESCSAAPRIAVHARRPGLVKEALAHVAEALRLYRDGAAEAGVKAGEPAERDARLAELRHHVAEARMIRGDAAYERLLAMPIPDRLDFASAPAPSRRRFQAWLAAKTRALDEARRQYEGVIATGQAHWAIAAAARVGQLFQDLAAQLGAAPIPRVAPPRGVAARDWAETFREAYCAAFEEQIVVLEDKAIGALEQCLATSTRLSWFNEWSALCEGELNRLRPRQYPLAAEIWAAPDRLGVVAERAPALARIDR